MSKLLFNCEICNYVCKDKRSFYNHVKKPSHLKLVMVNKSQDVNAGIPELKEGYKCSLCSNEYKHRTSLARHMLTCKKHVALEEFCSAYGVTKAETIRMLDKMTKEYPPVDEIPGVNNLARLVESEQLDKKQYSAERVYQEEPKQIINMSTTNINQTTNITNTITQNNNNVFVVMPFGQEDLSMISDDIRKNIITRGYCAFGALLDEIYKYPQNNNIHLYDKRNGLVKYIDTNKNVKVTKLKTVIEDIVGNNFDRIDYFIDEHIDTVDSRLKKYVEKLRDAHADREEKRKRKDKYAEVSVCKLNEIAGECKANFDKLKSIKQVDLIINQSAIIDPEN